MFAISSARMRLCQVESPSRNESNQIKLRLDSLLSHIACTFEFILHFVRCSMVSVTKPDYYYYYYYKQLGAKTRFWCTGSSFVETFNMGKYPIFASKETWMMNNHGGDDDLPDTRLNSSNFLESTFPKIFSVALKAISSSCMVVNPCLSEIFHNFQNNLSNVVREVSHISRVMVWCVMWNLNVMRWITCDVFVLCMEFFIEIVTDKLQSR